MRSRSYDDAVTTDPRDAEDPDGRGPLALATVRQMASERLAIVGAVPCPDCGAPRGAECVVRLASGKSAPYEGYLTGRRMAHMAREYAARGAR